MARRKITEVAVGSFGENDHILAELNGALQRITIDSVLKKARFSTAKVDDEGYLHFYDDKEKDKILSSKGETSAEIVESEDRLYLMSRAEVGFDAGSVPYANEVDADAENTTFGLYTDNNSRVKKTYNGTGSASGWWLRSPEATGSTNFAVVYSNGYSNSWIASGTFGVCPGFSI